MEVLILNSLTKVFSDEKPTLSELNGLSMLKNERSSFQIAVFSEINQKISIKLNGFDGCYKVYNVKEVPVKLPCFDNVDDYYLKKTVGNYPDCLVPSDGSVEIIGGNWFSFWIELSPDNKLEQGIYEVTAEITGSDNEVYTKTVTVEIIGALLPKADMVYTNWFHCDGYSDYYKIEVFSEEFWRVTRNYVENAVMHGMNCILTPLFTPPLDTAIGHERMTVQLVDVKFNGKKFTFGFKKLKQWIDMCLDCGIEYFEMSHLFTQWGALHAPKVMAKDKKGRMKKIFGWETRPYSKKYDAFILQLGNALSKFIDREGIREKCFFHVSDEPSDKHLSTYRRRSALINKAFPGFTVIDALSELEFYKSGAVKQPIPCTNCAEEFYGIVPELWTYYCCGQGREYLSNRFIAMPSQRNRILGTQLYKFNVKGFLQWGYNFYNTQYSYEHINPYLDTDAGGHFPAGDSFMTYPGENGEVYNSLRLKVFYDGFQDLRAMKLLESLIGREKTLSIIEKELDSPITFRDYPHSDFWQLEMRERINSQIKANI